MSDSIPDVMFRRQVMYRAPCPGISHGVPACGFLLKPGRESEMKDVVPTDYVAVYVMRGTGTYVDWNGQSHPLTAGDVAQRLPGRRHSTLLVPDGQWAECFLVLNRQFYEALAACGCVNPLQPVLRPGLRRTLVDQFESILDDLSHGAEIDSSQTLLKAHGLLNELHTLDRASLAPDPHAELVLTVRRRLGEDLGARLSLPDLAASFNLSYERLRKIFRERTGVSPGAYRIRRRMEEACRLIAAERLSVKETADLLGFPDVYNFSKQFKQVIGTPPARFRKGG